VAPRGLFTAGVHEGVIAEDGLLRCRIAVDLLAVAVDGCPVAVVENEGAPLLADGIRDVDAEVVDRQAKSAEKAWRVDKTTCEGQGGLGLKLRGSTGIDSFGRPVVQELSRDALLRALRIDLG